MNYEGKYLRLINKNFKEQKKEEEENFCSFEWQVLMKIK